MQPHRGFTMVELMVVMSVMGVLAAIAAPRLMDRTALLQRGFQDQFQSMLRQSRATAVAQRRAVCVQRLAGTPQRVQATYLPCGVGAPLKTPGSGDDYVIDTPPGTAVGGALAVTFDANGRLQPAANTVFIVGARTLLVNGETGVAVYQN